ncbi:SAM-dependent methyltransferase [Methanococcoides methylutens]|nr:class I SAM-dependent methyltransferase [Methanococcoides methylutens]
MLEYHLNRDVDLASRNSTFIKDSVEWMTDHFNIEKGTRICDFGCGPGLYTTRFAKKGAIVKGVDFSERSIRYARETASKNVLEIDHVLQNYLDFDTQESFDLITMIFCDFCALSPDQRKILLGKFYEFLDDDGSIFLDVCSISAFDQREETIAYGPYLMDGFWSANEYYGFMNTFKYGDEKVVLDKYTIIEESGTIEVYNWLQYYGLASIRKELEDIGFCVTEHYSNVSGVPYDPKSPEFAIVAKKKNK